MAAKTERNEQLRPQSEVDVTGNSGRNDQNQYAGGLLNTHSLVYTISIHLFNVCALCLPYLSPISRYYYISTQNVHDLDPDL